MNKLFQMPLVTFLRIVSQNNGFSGKGIIHSLPWFLEYLLFEPLRWVELITKSKQINEHSIDKQPIFILGYYRSGTTYLQELFRQDDRLGYLSVYQTVFPQIMLTCESWMTPVLESLARLFRQRNVFQRIPFTWNSTGEEDIALCRCAIPQAAQWGYLFPQKMTEYYNKYVLFDDVDEEVIKEWKRNYLQLLKKISIANDDKRLVLKNPPNTARIPHLLKLFPDAVFIHLRRNPYEVFASNRILMQSIFDTYSLGRTKVDIDKLIVSIYFRVMDRYLIEREQIKPGRLIEVNYEDLIRDPVAIMKSIYKELKMEDFSYCEPSLKRYTVSRKNHLTLLHKLTDAEVGLLSRELGSIISRLGYPVK